MIIWCCFVNRH